MVKIKILTGILIFLPEKLYKISGYYSAPFTHRCLKVHLPFLYLPL